MHTKCDKGDSSVLPVSVNTVITGNIDEGCRTELLCDETVASEVDDGVVDMVRLDGYDLVEQMTAAIEKKDEVRFDCLLQEISMCKTNKKYFKQESGSLMATSIMCDFEHAVRHLIKAGAQRSNLNSYGDTHILMAIRHNRMSVLKTLTELKQDINSKNKHGHFPLFLAADMNCADVVKLLIKAGANVNMKMGRVKMISEDYRRDNRVSVPGESLAHIIVHKIVYSKSKVTDLSETYREMLFAILDERSFDFAKYSNSLLNEMLLKEVDDEDIYKRLLRNDCQIKVACPYHSLCTLNSKTCVILLEHLKKQQPNVDIPCEHGRGSFTALAVACQLLNVDAVEWLLLNGANPNSRSSKSYHGFLVNHFFELPFVREKRYGTSPTPMHIAVCQTFYSEGGIDALSKIIKLLIKHGGDVNARSSENCSVLNTAMKAMGSRVRTRPDLVAKAFSVIHLLLQAGANPDSCFVSQTCPKKVTLTLESFTNELCKGIILMMIEMSFSLGRETGLSISEIVHRFRALRNMISDDMIDRCFRQPRTLLSQCRKVILDRCKACHLLEVKKHFPMLPVMVQDYLTLKDLLDFTNEVD